MSTATVDLTKPERVRAGRAVCCVERAELTLALPDQKPLAALGLAPDPLQQLATALSTVRYEAGERADVVIDLVPVRKRRLARRRRRLLAASRRRGPSAYGEQLTRLGPHRRDRARCVCGVERRQERGPWRAAAADD